MAHFRKERKEIKVEKSEFRIQRLSMKVVSIMSLIIGGLIPILFWTQNNVSPTNPLNQNEAILFIWLIFVAIINITFSIITFKQSIEKEDTELRNKITFYLYSAPLLILGGGLPLGALYLHMWYKIKKLKKMEEIE